MRPAAIALLCASLSLAAVPASAGPLTVSHAWARATPPGSTVGAVYLMLDNSGGPADRLLAASSPAADMVQVHVTEHEGNMMTMRRVDPLDIAAGATLTFAPGGMHVMLMGLKAPLVAGHPLTLTLHFEHRGDVEVDAQVIPADATGPAGDPMH